ncbi:MAG: YkgJ family cysteine cluster protein [Planctomycetota bacterium]|jgi:Fe-S-cluster containining protein
MRANITPEQVRHWWDRSQDDAIASSLESINERIVESLSAVSDTCLRSGRCCQFKSFGHRLFTTGIETAHSLRRARRAGITLPTIEQPSQQDDCPFLKENMCSIHEHRPAGCRIFYCDPRATELTQRIYEQTHESIRLLHERHDIPYVYTDWLVLLDAFDTHALTGD